ncbi:uncharacterized protein N7446_003387 [Penicillium canescens]|uniref:uncharacterized protein n=1 Tax=Penicillium canescens TaxID=5083 RepID=UPI0026E10E7F|nr:uncharacterized protein N7446_003387 [Penicillium canescens]KAJ6075610.1 hypothetical protein N7446_003387 [Penicillium canescens]
MQGMPPEEVQGAAKNLKLSLQKLTDSQCDRIVPVCVLCHKFGRRCVYERQTKTPLTRRYLTEVESELARTKALLQRFVPDEQNLDHALASEPGGPERALLQPPRGSDAQHFRNAGLVSGGRTGSAADSKCAHTACHGPFRASTRKAVTRALRASPLGPSGLSLESPPSSSNFEWDERTGKATGDSEVGVASGAALLRITDTQSNSEDYNSRPYPEGSSRQPCGIPFSLTSLSQLEPFVDAYFSLYHQSYPIVHEAKFRAQFMEVIPRPTGNAWQVLLFVLAAVGAFTASTQPTDVDLGLFEAAKARLSIDMLETGNLLLVQALTLISNYMQKRNKPNSGYNYMGLARRIAMGIGLHKEFPTWETNLLTIEMRRRVWYCLYIFDVGAIITFSRPLDFPDDGIEVELPLNVHDSDVTSGTKQIPQPANETTVYTHLRAQATFHMASSQIYSRIISSPFPSANELIELDDRLIGHWLARIPAFFQENVVQTPKFRLCHSIVCWRYRNFRILMYRPFLVGRLMVRPERGASTVQENGMQVEIAIQRCLDAARESVQLISSFWAQEQKSMMACWYGLYFLFQAVLIPVICLRNDPQCALATGWRDQITQAMHVLESMTRLNPTASRCLGVIRSLCGSYFNPSVDGWGPTEESPQTQLANLYPLMWPTLEMAQLDGTDSTL